jgi:murein DD-endopeptidase MepM/ murein hydrolase activator NlpD
LKTAINQIVRVPSSAMSGMNLDSLMAITVMEKQRRAFPELSKYKQHVEQPRKLIIGLGVAIGAASLALLSSLHAVVVSRCLVSQAAVAATPIRPALLLPVIPEQQPSPIAIAPKVAIPTVLAKQITAIPIVEPISAAALAQAQKHLSVTTNSGGMIIPANLPNGYATVSGFVYPLATPTAVGSPFGWRIHPISGQKKLHAGIDFEAAEDAPILAAVGGRVITAGWQQGYGKTVVIERNGQLQTLYGHMSNILVKPGQDVMPGTVIGAVGSTGQSTGAHLHFEMLAPTQDGWVAVDPTDTIQYALGNLQQAMMQSYQRPIASGS